MSNATDEDNQPGERPPLTLSKRSRAASTDDGTVESLIVGLKAEQPEAYNRLYGLMADRLFRAAFRLLRDRQEAEDAVQQAFLELIRAGCPPEEGRSLEAWLYTSVRYTCADQFRRRARRPFTATADLPERDEEDEYWLGFDPELETALRALTASQRLIVHLKHVEGLDGQQIAEIVGSNRVAVYAMAGRAERRLGRLLTRPGRPASPGRPMTAGDAAIVDD